MNCEQVMQKLLKHYTAYPDKGEYLFCDKCGQKFEADNWDQCLDHLETHKKIKKSPQIISKHNIDDETTSYQVALKCVDCVQEIKELLNKKLLTKYEIDCITDLFDQCLKVDKSSTLDKNYLSNHKITYCMKCGSEIGCNCESVKNEI